MNKNWNFDTKNMDHYILLFLILALFFYSSIFLLKFDGLTSPDQMDYAQIARNLYYGNGMVTNVINPISLTFINSIENHPDLLRQPLFPILVAASFRIFGINDAAVTLISGFFYILLIPLIYLLAREIFGNKVGLWAGVLALTSYALVKYSMKGLSETAFTFCFILLLYLLYKRANYFLIGFVMGLCYLIRYNFLFFLPGIFLFIYTEYPNWKKDISIILLIFTLTISPWLIRNIILVGDPLFNLNKYTIVASNFQYASIFGSFEQINILNFILSHPLLILKKTIFGFKELFQSVPNITFNFFISAFGIVGFFDMKKQGKNFNFFLSVFLIMITQMIVLSGINTEVRYFIPFVPIIIILASYKIVTIIDNSITKNNRRILIGFFIITLIFTNFAAIFMQDYSKESYVRIDEINYIKSTIPKNETIVTDVPVMIAWYAERTGIWFPSTYNSTKTHLQFINYVYFSPYYKEQYFKEEIITNYLNNSEFNKDFEIIHEFDSGGVLFKKKGTQN